MHLCSLFHCSFSHHSSATSLFILSSSPKLFISFSSSTHFLSSSHSLSPAHMLQIQALMAHLVLCSTCTSLLPFTAYLLICSSATLLPPLLICHPILQLFIYSPTLISSSVHLLVCSYPHLLLCFFTFLIISSTIPSPVPLTSSTAMLLCFSSRFISSHSLLFYFAPLLIS